MIIKNPKKSSAIPKNLFTKLNLLNVIFVFKIVTKEANIVKSPNDPLNIPLIIDMAAKKLLSSILKPIESAAKNKIVAGFASVIKKEVIIFLMKLFFSIFIWH